MDRLIKAIFCFFWLYR